LKATYSQTLCILVSQYTGLNLHSVVRVKIYNMDVPNLTVSGVYAVSAISRGISGDQYFEKIQMTSTGPGNTNVALF
jgi:hypothetical protein